jgi:ribonuclease VapC
MFVDASPIVAIMTREPEADALADLLETARSPTTSPIAIFAALGFVANTTRASIRRSKTSAISRDRGGPRVRTAPITDQEAHTALTAFSRYGKGRGYPSATALPTPWQETQGPRCCSRATISTRPTSAQRPRRQSKALPPKWAQWGRGWGGGDCRLNISARGIRAP